MTDLANITAALVALGIPRFEPTYARGRWEPTHRGISWYIEDWSDLPHAIDDGFTQSVAIADGSQDYASRIDFCCDASGRLVRIELDHACPRQRDEGIDIPTQALPLTTTPAEAVARLAALDAEARRYIAAHHCR